MNEQAIFTAALDKKTPADRQAFLDQACAGNSDLRAQVEALLKADSDAGSFLEHPPLPIDATVASGETARSSADSGAWISRLSFLQPCNTPGRIGKLSGKVGEYEIIEMVGHGGMGAVLRAFDTKLSRVVAVKVMAPELAANAVAVKRFLREATTAAAVHHDHVVTIHAVDDSHQPPYLVMQFIEGQTLQEKIDREGALDLKSILRIGSQAAAGLAAAHKTGLIHRDVKPSNILLENGVERVKISDFGLARAADDLQVTQTGIIAGTPQYMSPEQAKGEPIDARSDLFSLGSVLYTMCTGRPAFRADNPIAVLRRVIDDPPRPIHEINAEIPDWLCEIVDKLLDKKPEQRFQSAQEVGDLLAQHLAHLQQPASCPMPPRVESARRTKELALPDQLIKAEARYFWATGILSVVAAAMVIAGFETVSRGMPSLLAAWLIGGGLNSLWVGLLIMYAAWQVETRQSVRWAWRAGLLSLLPINPFLVFCLPITIWSLATLRRAELLRQQAAPQKPSRPTPGQLIIEHPVLGLVAILMLIVSASVATYMLTAAWMRTRTDQSAIANIQDQQRIQGTWFAVRGERNGGQPVPTDELAQMRLVFKDDQVQYQAPQGQAGGDGNFQLLTAAKPKRINIMRAEGKNRFGLMGGIYELNGNHLRICMGEPEETITEFKTRPGTRQLLVDLERQTVPGSIILPVSPGQGPASASDPKSVADVNIPGLTWVSLFNGKDLTGWKTHPSQPGGWFVEGGVLVGRSVTAHHHLFSERGDYENFHLRAEVKLDDNGNSGIYFRSEFGLSRGDWPQGYEAQLINVFSRLDGTPPDNRTGSLYIFQHNSEQLVASGEWFTLEIIAQGPRIVIKVNGRVTADYTDEERTFQRGHLALQATGPHPTLVRFRKIEIKELPLGAIASSSNRVAAPLLGVAPFDKQKAKAHQENWASHLGVPVELTNSIGMKLRLIPPGEFMMGGPASGVANPSVTSQVGAAPLSTPEHRVRLTRPIVMGVHEVTIGQFRAFVDDAGYKTVSEVSRQDSVYYDFDKDVVVIGSRRYNWRNPGYQATDNHPVGFVAWRDAIEFCQWLSKKEGREYRLPTEAEWEFVCRAGTRTRYSFGNDLSPEHANHKFTGPRARAPVGHFMPNSFGLCDMHGNLYEWCADAPRKYTNSDATDPFVPPPAGAEIIAKRGGSYSSNLWPCGSWIRSSDSPDYVYGSNGFRVVLVGDLASLESSALGATAGLPSTPNADGWVQLFNGNDLTGWKTHPEEKTDWKVEDGLLVGRAGHLFSDRGDYRDFQFRVEALINDGGNSGQLFRTEYGFGRTSMDGIKCPLGYEADIIPMAPGTLHFPRKGSTTMQRIIRQGPLVPRGEWFKQEVIARDNHITIRINEREVVNYVDLAGSFSVGHLIIQAYGPDTEVRFRRVEIKELMIPDAKQ